MAEHGEAPEQPGEGGASEGAPSPAGASLAAALPRRRAGAKDPEYDAFLRQQTRLAEIQAEHLHEQRELTLSRLRWGRFSDRLRALLQVTTLVVGLGVVALLGLMVWQAHEDHGLVVDAFSTPPDLARAGLTGQVAASRFLDKLEEMQRITATSDRPAQSFETNWGSEIKVEIPQTGLTFGEFEKLLREKIGHTSHISGEVMSAPQGISVTARLGDASTKTFTGPVTAFDDLAQKAAEAVYRDTQPYRYAEYLADVHRTDEAFAAIAELAATGPASEKGWAYAKWAQLDLNEHGDAAAALAHGAVALGYGQGSEVSALIARLNAQVWIGHDEDVRRISIDLYQRVQVRRSDTSKLYYEENRLLARAYLSFIEPAYADSAAAWLNSAKVTPNGQYTGTALSTAMAVTSLALGHDLPAARDLAGRSDLPENDAFFWEVAQGAFEALPSYWLAAEAGDWDAALRHAADADAVLEAGGGAHPIYQLMQRVWVWPLRALALAHTGQREAARALIEKTPPDCHYCLQVRGEIAVEAHDLAAADRWLAQAVQLAPSEPVARVAWARVKLARGDADGAIAVLAPALKLAPRYADPLEAMGEALARKGDRTGAADRFAQAARLAPHWANNHIAWAETLIALGRTADARRELQAAMRLPLNSAEKAKLNDLRGRAGA